MDLRCFIAIEITPKVKESIRYIVDILGKTGAAVKWVPAENVHLTLKFLGSTDESLIDQIKATLCKKLLTYNPFYIKIAGVGCFPNTRHPRVIWVGVESSDVLLGLHKNIDEGMAQFGYPVEKRDFSPHLTIGRVKAQKRIPEMIRLLNDFRGSSFDTIEVSRIHLMKSELKPAGAEYYSLAEIPLGRRTDAE
jgi:2'-5' RNA ligase